MSWTYSGNPASSARDEVRFLVGDTDVTKPWTLQDAEIGYAVTLYSGAPPVIGQNYRAAEECAYQILAKLKGTLADKSIGDLRISFNNQSLTFFQQTANRMKALATLQAVPVSIGGASRLDKAAQDADPDRVQPAFKVGGMDKVADDSYSDVILGQ
jgi:hypothetical protein